MAKLGPTTVQGNLGVSGNITASGDVTAYSDVKLKTDIKRIDNALDKVTLLNGYTFNKIGVSKRKTGVIAQEVLEVLPEAVILEGDYYSVAYGNMIGLLIEAIREQQVQIDELRKKLESGV